MEHLAFFKLSLKKSLVLNRDCVLNLNLSPLLLKLVYKFLEVVYLRLEISLLIVACELLNNWV